MMLNVFEFLVFQIGYNKNKKFTNLLEVLLKHDDDIKSLPKSDSNTSILKLWNSKFYARTGMKTILKVFDEFNLLKMEYITKETSNVRKGWEYIDDLIDNLIYVARKDIEEASRIISPFVNNSSISASSFWIYLNNTWDDMLRLNESWSARLSSLLALNRLTSARPMDISQWINNNVEAFDIDEYNKTKREEKSDNQLQAKFRTIANIQSSLTNNFRRGGNLGNTNNGRRRIGGNQYKSAGSDAADKLFKWLLPKYQSIAGNVRWPSEYCGYYHTKEGCVNTKCTRKHKCPVCDEEHKIDQCKKKSK